MKKAKPMKANAMKANAMKAKAWPRRRPRTWQAKAPAMKALKK